MNWLPSGFGYNVPTVFWLQTTALEVVIFTLVWFIPRIVEKRMERYTEWADAMMRENEADKELKRLKGHA